MAIIDISGPGDSFFLDDYPDVSVGICKIAYSEYAGIRDALKKLGIPQGSFPTIDDYLRIPTAVRMNIGISGLEILEDGTKTDVTTIDGILKIKPNTQAVRNEIKKIVDEILKKYYMCIMGIAEADPEGEE